MSDMLQNYLDNAMKTRRDGVMASSDQLTLGKMIEKLKPMISNQEEMKKKYDDYPTVVFDFEYLYPTGIDSWRGSYSELALSFEGEDDSMSLKKFYTLLRETNGKEFTGYKGGEYIMHEDTPIWVANYGNSGSTAVIDIVGNEYEVIIITGYREF